jgi:hypothetical protein
VRKTPERPRSGIIADHRRKIAASSPAPHSRLEEHARSCSKTT